MLHFLHKKSAYIKPLPVIIQDQFVCLKLLFYLPPLIAICDSQNQGLKEMAQYDLASFQKKKLAAFSLFQFLSLEIMKNSNTKTSRKDLTLKQ